MQCFFWKAYEKSTIPSLSASAHGIQGIIYGLYKSTTTLTMSMALMAIWPKYY